MNTFPCFVPYAIKQETISVLYVINVLTSASAGRLVPTKALGFLLSLLITGRGSLPSSFREPPPCCSTIQEVKAQGSESQQSSQHVLGIKSNTWQTGAVQLSIRGPLQSDKALGLPRALCEDTSLSHSPTKC